VACCGPRLIPAKSGKGFAVENDKPAENKTLQRGTTKGGLKGADAKTLKGKSICQVPEQSQPRATTVQKNSIKRNLQGGNTKGRKGGRARQFIMISPEGAQIRRPRKRGQGDKGGGGQGSCLCLQNIEKVVGERGKKNYSVNAGFFGRTGTLCGARSRQKAYGFCPTEPHCLRRLVGKFGRQCKGRERSPKRKRGTPGHGRGGKMEAASRAPVQGPPNCLKTARGVGTPAKAGSVSSSARCGKRCSFLEKKKEFVR